MSTTIDERVVSMQFDNKQFESNVKTSMSTLDKLKQSLNLTSASKGLESVSSAARNCNLNPLSSAVETVKYKFSALEVMAVTALANITNSAVNAGKRLVSAFTIDPIKSGFQEYETQINAVQTILANTKSKGTVLDDVNQALDELNHYADMTIYNFTEMTRNIGTFTAAGVDLDTSVAAIKGIANLAAVSGSTSQQASTAMYQLSQALASGTVKLMDWNSVVNAGMGGQVFQDALKETARVHGIAIDDMIKKEGSFRETLSKGWLSSEILTETLQKFTGDLTEEQIKSMGYTEKQAKEILELGKTANDAATKVKTFTQLMDTLKEAAQSGWTQTWELLVGDFEEAKSLWTGVSDVLGGFINDSAESRNSVLEGALTSNWDKLIKQINDAGLTTEEFEKNVKEAAKAHDIDLDKLIKKYGSLEEVFRSEAASADILKEALHGVQKSSADLSGITRTIKQGAKGEDVKQVEQALTDLGYDLGEYGSDGFFGLKTVEALKAFQEANGLVADGILGPKTLEALQAATKSVDELDVSCDDLIDNITKLGGRELLIESLKNVFSGLLSVVKPIKNAFNQVFPPMTAKQLYGFLENLRDLTAKFKLTRVQTKKLHDTFRGFFSVIDIGWTGIKAFAGGIVKLLGNLSGLGDGILNIGSSLGLWLSGLRDSVKETDIFGKAVDGVVGFLQKVIDKVKAVFSFFKEKFAMPGFEGFFSLMKGIWNIITKVGGKIAEIGSGIGSFLGNAFKSGDISELLKLLNTGLITGILLKFKDIIGEGWGGLFGGIKDNLSGITDILDSVKSSLEAWQSSLKSGILLKIAIAIGILAASILVLASIDPGKLATSLGAITVLFSELLGSLAIFGRISPSLKGTSKAMASMIGISVAVLILSSALKSISSLSWEELIKGLAGVLGLMVIVVGATKLLGTSGKKVVKGATQMVIMAAALKILASVCKDLSSLSWEEIGKGLAGVAGLMAIVSLFLRTAKFSGKSIATATGIVILSAAIKILASACKDFSNFSWEEIGKGLAAIGALFAELAIFTNVTGNAKHVVSTGLSLVLIGAAMKIFSSAVSDFSIMNWEEIGKGLAAMAGSLLAVALSTKLMPKNMIGIGTGLVIVSAALIILANALTKMSGMSWEEIGKGMAALGGSMAILAIGLNLMKGTLSGSATLLIAAAALAILTPVLTTLGSMSWASIAKGLIAIAGAFTVIGVAGALLGPIVPAILGVAGALALVGLAAALFGVGVLAIATGFGMLAAMSAAGATAIVASLTIIVTGLASLIPTVIRELGNGIIEFCKVIGESATEIAKAINAVILAILDVLVTSIPSIANNLLQLLLGILNALVEHTPQIVDAIIDFLISALKTVAERTPELVSAVMDVITSLFAAVTDAIVGLDGNTLAKAAIGVALMTALMALFNAIAPLIPGALIGVLGMGVMLAELALVIAAIGALGQLPGLQWLIGEGATVLQNIGNAIGGFVGGIIGGIAEGVTSSLPQIGTDLSNFMTNLNPFIEGAKSIDQSVVDGVSSIVSILTSITAASLLESITSWITGSSSIETFGTQLVSFGESLKSFSDSIIGIDTEAISSAATAASSLTAMADAIPNTGGVWSVFAGDNDMGTFGGQLVTFGISLKAFSNSVTGIDTEAITAAATASSSLAAMADAIPNTGGLWSVFAGDNDIATFGTQLVSFGSGLKSFSDNVTGIDTSAITSAATAASSLATMADAIPTTGGLWTVFTGDNDIGTFGTQLASFGTGLKSFSDNVTGMDIASVTAATAAASSLSAMANTIPDSGGLFSWFTGDNSMDTFGDQIAKFGSGLKGFADNVVGINVFAVMAAISASKLLNSMANAMADGGNMENLKTYGNNIKDFGYRLGQFYIYIEDVDSSKLSSITKSISTLASIDSDGSGLSKFIESLGKIGTDGVTKFISAFDKSAVKASRAGAKLVTNLIKGITSKSTALATGCRTLVSKAATAIKSKFSDFYEAGKFLVSGFSSGISANSFKASSAASSMAKSALKAAKAALREKSPSKESYKIGAFFGAGFVNSLTDYIPKVYDASYNVADYAKKGLSKAVSKIGDVIEGGIDSQPTIRPVLDLSDIANGASAINGMLDMNPSVGVMSNIGAISSMMNKNQNGANNDDVISAIRDLGRQLGNVSGDTYNVGGVTYDDGSNIADAVKTLVRAAKVERRI